MEDIRRSGLTSAVVDEKVEQNSSLSSPTSEPANGISPYHLKSSCNPEANSSVISVEQHGDCQNTQEHTYDDDHDEDGRHRSTPENIKGIQPQESSICDIESYSSSGEVALTDNGHNLQDVKHRLSVTSGDNSYSSDPGKKHSLMGIQREVSDLNNHCSLTTKESDSVCGCKSSEHILDLHVVTTSSPVVTMEMGTYSYPTTFENREVAMDNDLELEICDRESESGREQQLET